MQLVLRVNSNERPGDHYQKMFKVRNSCRVVRVLRRARLPCSYVLSMRKYRLARQTAVESDLSAINA
jgi:hypothetical protein